MNLRQEFPLLAQTNLTYLDSAATTQKPQTVLDEMDRAYRLYNANVHRSPHSLGREMTRRYEAARAEVAAFFGAGEGYQVVFTSGATDALNLAARSFLEGFGRPGQQVIVLLSEHHSNFVPWQQLCRRQGMALRVIPVGEDGRPDLEQLRKALTKKTCIVAAAHVTNTFGVENPVEEIIRLAHAQGVPVLLDGAQAAAHQPVDVQALGCDFYCVSSHKLYGPTGIGALIARKQWLESMPPVAFGGEMVELVTIEETRFAPLPARFEAGTPNFIGAVGFARALGWLGEQGMEQVARREQALTRLLWEKVRRIPGVVLPLERCPDAGILSFLLPPFSPYDVALLLDQQGVALREGLHCAHPLMQAMGLPQGTIRASLGIYNSEEDIERLCAALRRIASIL